MLRRFPDAPYPHMGPRRAHERNLEHGRTPNFSHDFAAVPQKS